MASTPKPTLNTSQKIRHVFECDGFPHHVHPGFVLLRTDSLRCPDCGETVHDVTNAPLGQAYFAFARFDLGAQQ